LLDIIRCDILHYS